MERRGPDSLEAWFIAFICCLISMLMYGASGLSGMLFVASVERFDTDRDVASFPYVLSTVLQAVSGPFAGYFANRFGSRIVIFVGSILGFVGIGTCFFAEDIMAITILWGIVFGIGFGFSSLLLPVIINEYFIKQRSLALGMCYLGSPIGFFIFPPIFEALLNNYGLSGTFLILSGINMHCLPLTILLRPPNLKTEQESSPLKQGKKHDSYSSTNSATRDQSPKVEIENKKLNGKIDSFVRRHSIEFLWNQSHSKEQATDKKYVLSLSKTCLCEEDNMKLHTSYRNIYENSNKNANDNYCDTPVITTTLSKNDKNCLKTATNTYCQKCEPEYITTSIESHSQNKKHELSHNSKNRDYDKVSTIYFGTDQSSSIPSDYASREKKHENTEHVLSFSNRVKYDSVFNSAYTLKVPALLKYKKTGDFFQPESGQVYGKQVVVEKEPSVTKNSTSSQNLLFSMYLNPVFILICVINAIVNLHFTSLVTIIIDFSRDQNIYIEYEKYIMIGISLSGGFGMMGLGWITDGGYMTKTNFGAFTQVISSICTVLFPFTVGFETLMIVLLLWSICQSSFIPLIPAITMDCFDENIQAVAVSACNVLCGPFYLVIPILIGYFRDERGSYDNIFYLLGILAFLDCIIVILIPHIVKWRSKKSVK